MSKISPCLWYDGEAEEAAAFYVSLLPDSRIEQVQRNIVDTPGGKTGTVLLVEFTLAGQRFLAVNGGRRFEYTHAISFKIDCADQAEVDRLWDSLSSNGGAFTVDPTPKDASPSNYWPQIPMSPLDTWTNPPYYGDWDWPAV